jgi:hypothetical protein
MAADVVEVVEVDAVDEVDAVAIAGDTDIRMIPTSIVNCMIGVDTAQRNVGQPIEKLAKQNLAISMRIRRITNPGINQALIGLVNFQPRRRA